MKEQAAVFQALMGNYETFKQIQSEFKEGLHFGSAEKENEAYVDSLNGKLNQLKEIWIDTLMVLADSDSLKGLLDTFISISEGINIFIKAIDKVGVTFPVLLGLISGTSSGFKGFASGIDSASEKNKKLDTVLGKVKNTISSGVTPAIKNFVTQGLLVAGVTGAVQVLAFGWEKATKGIKNNIEELSSKEDEYLSSINNYDNKIKVLETTGKKYEELANKTKRTAEEEEEMLRLGNELAEVLPQIKVGEDENGNAIISMTEDMDGYLKKTKEARAEQEKLLLGTRMEKGENAIKMITDGEFAGKNFADQMTDVETQYNAKMMELRQGYLSHLKTALNQEGVERSKSLAKAQQYRDEMVKQESLFASQYADIQNELLEYTNIIAEEMYSHMTVATDGLVEALNDDVKKDIQDFYNLLDFSEVNTDEEYAQLRKMFTELPKLAQEGAVDFGDYKDKLSEINSEYAKTDNVEQYNKKIDELAKSLAEDTNWDVDVIKELFTVISNGSLESAVGLDGFLNAFNKTKKDISNGDNVAKALQKQYEELLNTVDLISKHDFSNVEANIELVTKLKTDENLPKQVRDMVDTLAKKGVDDEIIIKTTAEVVTHLQDGELNEEEVRDLKTRLKTALNSKFKDKTELDLAVEGIIKSFNNEDLLQDITDRLGGENGVTQNITVDTHGEEKVKELNESIKLLTERDLYTELKAVVDGDEDYIYFAQIVKNLPASKQSTYDFIFENKQALSELESYQDVVEYIKANPTLIQKYNIDAGKLGLTIDQYKELDEVVKGTNGQEVNIETNGDDVLKTIEDVESLINIIYCSLSVSIYFYFILTLFNLSRYFN